jgi:hypothetical protein
MFEQSRGHAFCSGYFVPVSCDPDVLPALPCSLMSDGRNSFLFAVFTEQNHGYFSSRFWNRVTLSELNACLYFPVKAGIFFDEASDILAGLLKAVRVPGCRAAGSGRGRHVRGRPGRVGRSVSSSPTVPRCKPTTG